ncbi:MAG: ATP-binding protein [Betaproteobacteria bacterium]
MQSSSPFVARQTSTLALRLGRAAHIAWSLVALVAVAALWGWVIDVPVLRDFGAGFAPMAPAASLAFLLLAGSFFVVQGQPAACARAVRSARLAAALAGVLAALSLVDSLTGFATGAAFEWLSPTRGGEVPAVMSPAASLTLLLLAVATPFALHQRVLGVSLNAVIAGLAGAIGAFALLGLSLRLLRFDIAAPLLGFSAPAALATVLAAFALGAARPGAWLLDTLTSRRTGAVVTRWLLPAAVAIPLGVGWLRLFAEREGVFGEAFGMSLFTLLMVALLCALILWVAHTVDNIAAQRAQAEEQADEQREWLQVTLAAIGDGVIATDAAGRVRFLNAAAQRLTGWRAAEAVGRRAEELLNVFDERDGTPVPSPLESALLGRAAVSAGGEPALRARDGNVHSVTINAAPIIDPSNGLAGAVLVLREAGAQRRSDRAMREAYTELDQRVVRRTAALERASAALRERNALLNAITTSTPDLIFAKDRQGSLLMANPAWRKAVGQAGQKAAGFDDKERLVLESGETMILEETLPAEPGASAGAVRERIYLATKSPLRDEQGRVFGLIGVATDITERKNAQRELEKLVVAEQRLRAEAERANRAKDEFLAIVSHELRSPLNALRGWAHLLLTTKPLEPPLVERAAKAIKRNVDAQTRLIEDLLDTSRIVSGKLNIERRVVNLVEIVLAALEGARPIAQGKQIQLRFTPDDAVIPVVGDAGRLQQLVANLLSNAVKFTPEKGSIALTMLRHAERVQLQVKDNGIGIQPEFLPHVFDRFTQADTSATRRAGGLGIGLALVRHIALLHGGQVRADSAGVGRGAAFTVDLPAAPAAAVRAAGSPVPTERRNPDATLARMRVWLADDDSDAHEVVSLTLRQSGAAFECFDSGSALAGAIERALPEGGPDVLLIDLAMPGEDGFEALRRVRSLELAAGAQRPIPALALTAFTQIERERLRAAGFNDRVDKPVDADKLVSAIRSAVEGTRVAAPS